VRTEALVAISGAAARRPSRVRPLTLAKLVIFAACCTPLVMLALRAFGIAGQSLGANPTEAVMDVLGKWGLRLLLVTLAITPLRVVFSAPLLLGLRRMLGLFAFTYIALHFLVWITLDRWLDFGAVLEDVAKRPFITVGLTALLLLIPLAVTSTAGWMRRLGRRWQRLHRLIYPAAMLGCVHYWWQVKADLREPLIYATVLLVLLGWRIRRARASAHARARSRE
jgi:methionine sulfoxide reductase heme-binding subunit